MLTILAAIARPFIGYIVAGIGIAVVFTGVYFKIKNDGAREALQRVEQEKVDAIDEAKEAREGARDKCDAAPDCQLPNDWFRD